MARMPEMVATVVYRDPLDVTGETMARLRQERDAWRDLAMALRGAPTCAKLTATGAAVRALLDLGFNLDTGGRREVQRGDLGPLPPERP